MRYAVLFHFITSVWVVANQNAVYSLDHETDTKVQKVIRESFRDCTVIMVAHRIHSLLDFDQVVVLNSGQLVELGHPKDLLNKPGGEFAELLKLES